MDVLVNTVVQSLIFVGIGLVVFAIAFLLIAKLSPFSIRKEIEDDQNTALGIVIGSVLAGGLFGHSSRRKALLARMGQQQRETTSKVIKLLRTEPGTLAQNAFRYVLADPRVSTVPSGARCVSELDDVARAADLGPLAPELIEALHELS